ncbi:DUF1878 family protein [Aeromonas caviae]|uniref:DUF1878 family protein n=1 Tax=Gammaproteobacteria TaxID=1236 RepID=UPI00005DF5C4|nr:MULTISPECIES: DUF1878 family protein [Gammaproteobacteria]ABK48546.1 hypothetical protein Shewana3_2317 [Shewanella sp. ANA-3]MDX7648071.1 DUF1878 family protein [Aeromonas caviae]
MSIELQEQIDKLRYHVKMLAESVDYREHPIPALVIQMDWDDSDLNRAHDVFEKYDEKLEAGEAVNWHEFEHKLREEFSIGYQTVKSIIIAFYANHQWTNVCREYAKAYECVEFHHITRGEGDL